MKELNLLVACFTYSDWEMLNGKVELRGRTLFKTEFEFFQAIAVLFYWKMGMIIPDAIAIH